MNNGEPPLPLLELFHRLRKEGFPLGIDEYELVLQALQHGWGLEDQESLARLCCTLWVKSKEETLLFNYHFQQVMQERKAQVQAMPPPVAIPVPDTTKKRFLSLPLELKPSWTIGGTLLLAAGIVVWLVTRPHKPCSHLTGTPYFASAPPELALVKSEYRYKAIACPASATDRSPKITVTKYPSWLTVTPNLDGTVTLSGSIAKPWRPMIRQWNLSGELKSEFDASDYPAEGYDDHPFPVSSPNGQYFAIRRNDRIIVLGNLPEGKITELKHSGIVEDVVFSPDSKTLATAAGDGLVRIWDLKGKLLNKLVHDRRVTNVFFRSYEQHLATLTLATLTEDGHVRLWSLPSDQPKELSSDSRAIDGFTTDGKHLITTTKDGAAELWDLSGKRVASVPSDVTGGDFCASFDEEWLVTGSASVRDWSNQQIAKLSFPLPDCYRLFSSKGQLIAAATGNTVRLWDLSGPLLKSLPHQNSVNSLDFSPDGKKLATSTDDTVQIWDIASQQGKPLHTLPNPSSESRVKFTPDGKYLVATSLSNVYNVELQVTDVSGKKEPQLFNIRVLNPFELELKRNKQQLIYLASAGGIILLLLAVGYSFARWWPERSARSLADELSREPETPTPEPASILDFQPEPEDEVQVGKAILAHQMETSEYFPVTGRQMKQSWRYLRRMIREGPPTELDIEATIKQVCQKGLLLNLVLRPRRVNRSELLLLLDQEGSMVPFHSLARRLAGTAAQGGRLAKADVYYFHNCPAGYFYNDPRCTEAMAINDVLDASSDRTGVLIFSDAGAAQGGFSQERIQLTQEFLEVLKQQIRYVAWLNPMPAARWPGTSAESIAQLVPMFEFNRQGLHEAIAVLRGKFIPYQ